MPEKPLQGWQRQAARNYLIQNKDASIAEAAKATNMGVRTIARARKQLVDEGILPGGRNSAPAPESPSSSDEPEVAAAPTKAGKQNNLLDAKALDELSKMLDTIDENEDDIESQKLMLRQVKRMAFDLRLHPDTRMSAMTLWNKLRDMTATRSLGPGKPLTEADAMERLVMLAEAVGAELWVKATYKAFGVADEGKVSVNQSEDERNASGTPSTQGSIPIVPNDERTTGSM
jgi:hypothetical protein